MSSPNQNKSVSGKILILGLCIIAFCLLYTGAWFWAAGKTKTWVTDDLANGSFNGINVQCANSDVRGYPFRIGIFCDTITTEGVQPGTQASFGAFRSAAQVYAPGHAVFELDGPAVVRPERGILASLDWDLLHGSVVAGLDGIDRTSIETNNAKIDLQSDLADESLGITLQHGELHMRRNNDDLDIAASTRGTSLSSTLPYSTLPPFGLSSDLTLTGYAPFLAGQRPLSGQAVSGEIRHLALDFGEQGSLQLSGPFTKEADGILSGEFDVKATNFKMLGTVLKEAFPDATQAINLTEQLLRGLTGDGETASVHLSVRRGSVFLGFIPLGVIPPL
ncbi:DUF2125 domain-containing protein [Rhizobium sp. L1K21]|uniref:DUF2125 domain-containing protein n=1 Tax=Rhizobium sp. L1K21 TaxID=2954933 RepID=UPI002093BDDD|nr:DUF2125 domain-containing protein [Rhizobium sp. L1K21]MCO6188164.1 DUF2125 domain-containing protein [Rhizobium sp. L1K21]